MPLLELRYPRPEAVPLAQRLVTLGADLLQFFDRGLDADFVLSKARLLFVIIGLDLAEACRERGTLRLGLVQLALGLVKRHRQLTDAAGPCDRLVESGRRRLNVTALLGNPAMIVQRAQFGFGSGQETTERVGLAHQRR